MEEQSVVIVAAAAPPLPPKTRNNCKTTASSATVFLPHSKSKTTPSSSSSSTSNNAEHVVKIRISPDSNNEQQTTTTTTTEVVRINVGDEMLHRPTAPYFFCNGFQCVTNSGQCSPSETLDSGTCSDLDSTPPPTTTTTTTTPTTPTPPTPKTTLSQQKGVSVTVIGSLHKRANSLTSSGADPDSGSDNDSNISCDSLNGSANPDLLPQRLLKDIRNRSANVSNGDGDDCEESNSKLLINESTYEDRKQFEREQMKINSVITDFDTDKFYKFHLNEHVIGDDGDNDDDDDNGDDINFVHVDGNDNSLIGYKKLLMDCNGNGSGSSTIRSAKGTVRGVKNRVRAGIATFLQINSTNKSYKEKDGGKVVVYSTTMGIVRFTYQQCLKVKQILRTHLVKFEERDVFMSTEYQTEIRDRMHSEHILVPQVFVDGIHIGDAETIERLNETGELRKILKPYKSRDACTTCITCGGYRLLPCQACNGSKKSVHRNHFTTEFLALKCMQCDEVGLVRCATCS